MPITVNPNGELQSIYANVGGQLRELQSIYTNVGGQLKEIHSGYARLFEGTCHKTEGTSNSNNIITIDANKIISSVKVKLPVKYTIEVTNISTDYIYSKQSAATRHGDIRVWCDTNILPIPELRIQDPTSTNYSANGVISGNGDLTFDIYAGGYGYWKSNDGKESYFINSVLSFNYKITFEKV